jgi:hypothetical protein
VNLPIVALALVTGRLVVPPSKNPHPKALDLVGAVTSIAGVVALVYAIIEGPTYGWLSARTIGIGAVGVALLAAWVAFELRSSHPMVDLRVFRNARFSAASFSVTMIFLALFGWLFLFSQQMQFVLGYNTLQAGVRALPFAITIGAVSQPAAKLGARADTKAVVTAGLAMMAVGGALGVAIMGSVASSLFTSRVQPALAHVPAQFAAQAKASVGAAVTVGQHAPGSVGHNLIDVARQAFVIGSDHAMLVAVAAALLGSLVAARFLPARAPGEAPSPMKSKRSRSPSSAGDRRR